MALHAAEAPIRYWPASEWDRFAAFKSAHSHQNCYEDDKLPKDPRQWTREDVNHWLTHMITIHSLPEVPSSRFLMNGKALCLMSPNMFLTRVPLGGKLLYKDFQLRLSAAMYSCN
ncbi:hypothetical protein HUJ04_000989 [Dendroctonus ponderosae]|uniref:PNT domain-containing protein n=1 Tax=Dendroctonus ponderosae TaxID=77166 RepID=A0AAR5QK62_DENPD|nr:hypothetical protein HUJ04_000989 [Dendroctonus ponderosae]KAH1018402.1 hypothetical protein HUJ05_006182 [Dendroctonus ponderosae]